MLKKSALILTFAAFTVLNAMSVYLHSDGRTAIRRSWSTSEDLLLLCKLGQNGQFNFSAAGVVNKNASDQEVLLNGKFKWKFHSCGDAVGVIYIYPDNAKKSLFILSGNHGFTGTTITLPNHGFTAADVGKKFKKNHWIAKVNSRDEFTVLPAISPKRLPKGTKVRSSGNFKATRIISRRYLLDGKPLETGKVMRGQHLAVIEKNGICTFDALAAAGFQHEKVTDFYAVYDISYNFYPNGSCRIDNIITFPREVCIRSINPVQDHDLLLPRGWFYEKYIPKMKKICEKPEYSFRGKIKPQVFSRPNRRSVVDTAEYDFAAIQDLTARRRSSRKKASRFEINVNGGYIDPQNQPDRFIEFIGRNISGKKVRLVGNVLGIDPEYGIARNAERAKNSKSFTLAAWHKTYITQFGQDGAILKPGTVLKSTGYRCYFNPQNIGKATALYTIPCDKGKKLYVDFHCSVKDHPLPIPAGAAVTVLEKSPGVTLNGSKISVSGNYGYAVIFIEKVQK